MTPFDFIKSINNKTDLKESVDRKNYNSYIVLHGFSYYPDTVLLANELNCFSNIEPRQHYDFLYHAISKKNRFSKWYKKSKIEMIEILKERYEIRTERAVEMMELLSEEELEQIRLDTSKGGLDGKSDSK